MLSLIEEQLSIIFKNTWFQEDINTLSQMIFKRIAKHDIKEQVLGADRETIRFTWQNAELALNFDYYSQSCWISAHDQQSQTQIPVLKNLLEKHYNA